MGRSADVKEVLRLDDELRRALSERDLEVVEARCAAEFTLHSPANRIQTRRETIDLLTSTAMRQRDPWRRIEAAYSSGPDVVVVMGVESLVWDGTGTDLDDRRTARRFTNVWRRSEGRWRAVARQATTVPLSSDAGA